MKRNLFLHKHGQTEPELIEVDESTTVAEPICTVPADWFADFEWTDLGELAGRDVVHLQCRLGTETVVFAERGARTVGLDISSEWIKQARRIAAEQGADVERTTHPFDVRAAGPRALRG